MILWYATRNITENCAKYFVEIFMHSRKHINSEHELRHAHHFAANHNVNSEPSASSVFAALQRYNFKSTDNVVIINTGNGLRNFQ